MKKHKLMALSILMLVCGKSISQTDIQKNSLVCIDTTIAKRIAIDLVAGDVCKEELTLVKSNLMLTQYKVTLKDSIINKMEEKEYDLNNIISLKNDMFSKQEEISKTLQRELTSQKATSWLYKILSLLGVVSTSYLIINK
jgi:hypothetical protein